MFERFTDRARKVMALANQEAQRLNHEYIGTEHVLLGLLKEGSGVGANVLKNLGVYLKTVRCDVEKLVKPGPEPTGQGKLPQTPRAKRVIEYAISEAKGLNHNYVGTEHLLLGLLDEVDGVAAQVLMNCGLTLEGVREEVINLLGAGAPTQVNQDMFERFTDRAREVMALANQEAQRLNHEYIGTEHILLGLLREGRAIGANVLMNLSANLKTVRREVEKLVLRGPEPTGLGKLPWTPRATRVIGYAISEARGLDHNYVGTEHLLLGLLKEPDGVAAQTLLRCRLTLEGVRKEVIHLLSGGALTREPGSRPALGEDPLYKVPEQFRDHPLVQHYLAIMLGLTEALDKGDRGADEQLAGDVQLHLHVLRGQLRKLVAWLRRDPNFGRPGDSGEQ